MKLFIGIDPSINSTGLTIQVYDEDEKIEEFFYIIKNNKLTKKEQKAELETKNFNYILYDKFELKNYKLYCEFEKYKTLNLLMIIDNIKEIIRNFKQKHIITHICIVQEGISYGSSQKTKSVFDLAGLNFLIRAAFIKDKEIDFIIASPAEVKKFATGNGNANKDSIISLFEGLKPELMKIPKLDDIADSYFMACLAKFKYDNY